MCFLDRVTLLLPCGPGALARPRPFVATKYVKLLRPDPSGPLLTECGRVAFIVDPRLVGNDLGTAWDLVLTASLRNRTTNQLVSAPIAAVVVDGVALVLPATPRKG